ncbi:DUF1631 family protein [Acidovorax lacteus]|uniref:DUF1631 family protein n=1 Tax=Acidovorax lacteus TaxID=1924988 RepID=A0ABP8KWS5_9BURK
MTSSAQTRYDVLYQQCLDDAAAEGRWLIEKLLDYTRYHLQRKESEVRHQDDRRAMAEAVALLQRHQRSMVEAFPTALRKAFDGALRAEAPTRARALTELRFEDLELLDAGQVQDHVEVARAQQMTLLHVEAVLAELNPLMCALAGLPSVQPERNPVHPQVYLRVLQEVMTGAGVPAGARMLWTLQMCELLGRELEGFYQRLIVRLREQGVQPVGYQRAGATAAPAAAGFHASNDFLPEAAEAPAPALLTAANLHDLLVHDEVPQPVPSRLAAFAQRFAQEFEAADPAGAEDGPPSDFPATLPGALEALDQTDHVEEVLQRLAVQQGRERTEARAVFSERMHQDADGTRQAVAREVVVLMIENLCRDERLLLPVRQGLRQLEPVLLKLVEHDARFFSDRDHPARRFMDEVTERSLAWDHVDGPGFAVFFKPVYKALKALSALQEVSAAHFHSAMVQIYRMWQDQHDKQLRQREAAVQALQHAEQRNLLAQRLQSELHALPAMAEVPPDVRDFVQGPWAQVLAEARLADRSGDADPGGYHALVGSLLWAATPGAGQANPARLTRITPGLLTGLRQGLRTIDYPARQTSAFLERLMGLMQADARVLAEPSPAAGASPAGSVSEQTVPTDSSWPSLPGEAWLGPQEARSSGFMSIGTEELPAEAEDADAAHEGDGAAADIGWEVGAWIDLQTDKGWVRSQLSWCSPHGTLFLFKQGDGNVCSMTRRMRDTLLAEGRLRVVAHEPVVTGALDAVARAAILNSLDVPVRLLDPEGDARG